MTASEFKVKCLKILDQVHQTGEPLEISKRGNVIAVLTPFPTSTPACTAAREARELPPRGTLI